jgi:lysophospholipase L1-like esterase
MILRARLAVFIAGVLGLACGDTGAGGEPGRGGGGGSAGEGRAGNSPILGGTGGAGNAGGDGTAGKPAGGNAGRPAGSGGGSVGGGGGTSGGGAPAGGRGGTGATSGDDAGGASGQGGEDAGGGHGAEGGDGPGQLLPGFEIAVLGSSTAAGEGASSSRGWVDLLERALAARVTGTFQLANLASGGYTTSNLLPDSGSSGNIDDAIERAPNLVVVALAGSNDLSNGVSTSTFLSRLATLRDTAAAAGIPVFFLSTAPKDLSNEEQRTLADWAAAIGEEFGTCWTPGEPRYSPCFIDVFGALASPSLGIAEEYGAGDGIHLNDAGHERIFEIAEPIVRAYVCSTTACE